MSFEVENAGVYEILKKQQDQFLQRYGKEYVVKTVRLIRFLNCRFV